MDGTGFWARGRCFVPRFFLSPQAVRGTKARIEGRDAHHLLRVLRLGSGDPLEISVAGRVYQTRISSCEDDAVVLEVLSQLSASHEPPVRITLWQGLCKGDKPEMVTQKAVELGAHRVVFFDSRFSVVHWPPDRADKKVRRLQRIAEEAGKQSQRDVIPEVLGPKTFSSLLAELAGCPGLILMPWEHENAVNLRSLDVEPPLEISVLIGPEGGFHPDEVQAIHELGGHTVSLGPRILRTETAGLVVLSIIGYRWGDLGSA